ncbi:cholinephosphotransferase 1-like isoform X2 [Ornithodoros turicata]
MLTLKIVPSSCLVCHSCHPDLSFFFFFSKGAMEKTTKTRDNFGGWVLPVEQMDHLRKVPYQYNASAGSLLECLFLQRFWTWCSKFVPEYVAPCVLTCLGLSINVLCCFILLWFSPDLSSEVPRWPFLLCAISLFLYQLLDALDGKQAINVQNTQLEEVYDHGCDALSTFFLTTSIAIALRLGDSPVLLVTFFFLSMSGFYSTHWQDHVTHVMVFGKVDVSECQFLMIIIHLVSAFYGQNLWLTKVLHHLELRQLLMLMTFVSLTFVIASNILIVLGKRTPLDAYVQRKQERTFSPAVPVLVLSLCLWMSFAAGLMQDHPTLFLVTFGFAYAKLIVTLVMTSVSYGDMDKWDSSLVAPLFLCLNLLLMSLPIQSALLCSMVYSIMDFARYFTYASWDLRDALDLWIFSIKYPKGDSRRRAGLNGIYLNGLNNKFLLKNAKTLRVETK